MAVPFLWTLTTAARAAYPAIVSGVWRGLSANRIQSILQATGMGIRRQTLLDIVARERGLKSIGDYLRTLRSNQRPNPLALPEALTKLTRQFAVTVEVRGTLADTEATTSQFITLSMDSLMEREDMEELAEEIVGEGIERYGMVFESVHFVDAVRSGELGVL